MNGATFRYDYLGNKLWELSAADAAKNLPFTAKYEYNESSQVIKTYNAAGQFTENTYNALGQLIRATDYLQMDNIEFKYLYSVEKYTTFNVTVKSGNFSGCSDFCVSEVTLQETVESLNAIYERLCGEYMLTDYDSDDYVLFKFQRLGHLVIAGQLGGSYSEQFLKFKINSDQTFLHQIVVQLKQMLQKSKETD